MINQLPINSTHIALHLIQSQKKNHSEDLIKTVHHDQVLHLAIENITVYKALI
jgi:hypothetical protein